MDLKNLKVAELSLQEVEQTEGGLTLDEITHYVKDWWNNRGWFRVL